MKGRTGGGSEDATIGEHLQFDEDLRKLGVTTMKLLVLSLIEWGLIIGIQVSRALKKHKERWAAPSVMVIFLRRTFQVRHHAVTLRQICVWCSSNQRNIAISPSCVNVCVIWRKFNSIYKRFRNSAGNESQLSVKMTTNVLGTADLHSLTPTMLHKRQSSQH